MRRQSQNFASRLKGKVVGIKDEFTGAAAAREEALAREEAAARQAAREQEEQVRREQEERRVWEEEKRRYEQQRRIEEQTLTKQRQMELVKREQDNWRLAKERETSAATLHRLRELIRMRYRMDIEIWNLRTVLPADRERVIQRGRMADAVLKDIYSIVDAWDETSWDTREGKVAAIIKDYLSREGPRWWAGNPPWKDLEHEDTLSDDDLF